MAFEEDFVSDQIIEKEIMGRKFKLKYLTGGEALQAIDEYMVYSTNDDGQAIAYASPAKRNESYIKRCVVEAPYDCEKLDSEGTPIGQKVPWGQAKPEERIQTLKKLKSKIFETIVNEVNKLNSLGVGEEKN